MSIDRIPNGANPPLGVFEKKCFLLGVFEKKFFLHRLTTFEWPKIVSEVIFLKFLGVVCIEKCFRNFEIVVGSAVSEISRFGPFGV